MNLTPEVVARFWSKVVINPDGCWSWSGGHGGKDGRAMLSVDGQKFYAYRVSYEIHHGPITDGLHVCHACDNPECSRPDHLWLGTAADNLRDAAEKGRLGAKQRARTHCKRGHEFTPENTRVIFHADGKAHRHCKTCTAERGKAWRAAHYVPPAPRTECRNGHLITENTYRLLPSNPKVRICRECEREKKARYLARKAARAALPEAA